MGGIFRNRFFIVFLIAACGLTVLTMGLNIAGYGNLVSDVINIITSPFQAFANMMSDSISGFVGYFTVFNELREENAELRQRLRDLESEIVEARAIREQNLMLIDFLDLKQERQDFRIHNATVIAWNASNYTSGFTINKGTFHGIERNMPVIAAGGVVGFISHADIRTSRVSPFIRTSNSIGAYIRRTGDTGIVEGDFELERRDLSRLVPLSRDADIQVGDRVYSSGYGGIYPEGLFIGTVAEIFNDPLRQTVAAHVEPGVNFNQLRDVMVILEFNWIFD